MSVAGCTCQMCNQSLESADRTLTPTRVVVMIKRGQGPQEILATSETFLLPGAPLFSGQTLPEVVQNILVEVGLNGETASKRYWAEVDKDTDTLNVFWSVNEVPETWTPVAGYEFISPDRLNFGLKHIVRSYILDLPPDRPGC